MDIDVHTPENRKLFDAMRADHPQLPAYILENCIRFYRAGVIDEMDARSKKKKRGRPPKKAGPPAPPPDNTIGAVTITEAAA